MADTNLNGQETSDIRSQTEGPLEDKAVYEARENGSERCGDNDLDFADGFISNYLKNNKGTYKPRESERECWGTDVGQFIEPDPDDEHEKIYQLIMNTAPEVRWRRGLFCILQENKAETSTRKCLTFLHSNVLSGIKATDAGCGESILINEDSAPKCLTCRDWMDIMEGLNFVLTSPDFTGSMEHVDIKVGAKTDKDALAGFCYILQALLNMTWTNLQTIPRLEAEEGKTLHNILALLCSGCGIDESDRPFIDELESRYPFLMKSLGFRRINKHGKLRWQRPDSDKEFRLLCVAFYGLFCSAERTETVL